MEYSLRTRQWTRAEYDRLIEIGVFSPGDRVELLGGDLVVAEPQSGPHYTAIRLVEDALRRAFGAGWQIRTQGPIALDDESEPEPDIAVAAGSLRDYSREHPARPVLVVEVSVSSLPLDRSHKGSLYARAGLADYWIVNLVGRVLEVYREPVADAAAAFGWRYGSTRTLRAEDRARRVPAFSPHSVHRDAGTHEETTCRSDWW
jgi:Uma2 family endonuclease